MGKKNQKYPKKVAVEEPPAPPPTQVVAPGPSSVDTAASAHQSAPFSSVGSELVPLSAKSVEDAKKLFEGNLGKPCELFVNFLPIDTKKLATQAFRYDVSITPSRPKIFLSRALKAFFDKEFRNVPFAFDSFANESEDGSAIRTNVYVFNQLQLATDEVQRQVSVDNRAFTVTIKLSAAIDMKKLLNVDSEGHMKAMRCFDVTLRSVFRPILENGNAEMVGKRLYFSNGALNLNEKNKQFKRVEILPGISQSAIVARNGLYLNIDIIYKAFRAKIRVLEFARYCLQRNEDPTKLGVRDVETLERELKGIMIDCTILGTNRVVAHKFTNLVPANTRFTLNVEGKQPRQISVHDYYREFKQYRVQYPEWPLIQVGNPEKHLFFPVELCSIARKPVKCDIVRETAIVPEERKARTIEVGGKMNYAKSREIQGMGLNLGNNFESNFTKVKGRVLDPPKLEYKNKTVNVETTKGFITPAFKVKRAEWSSEKEKFLEPATGAKAVKWAILSTTGNRNSTACLADLSKKIQEKAQLSGLNFIQFQRSTENVFTCYYDRQIVEDKLRELKQKQFEQVYVIFQDYTGGFKHDEIKNIAQSKQFGIGILTQCILQQNFDKMLKNPNFYNININNWLNKSNPKLNGVNYKIIEPSFEKIIQNTMFIGADVNHPGTEQKPSIVGIAASYDKKGMKYIGDSKFQKSCEEMIDGLDEFLRKFLKRYFDENKTYPKYIMYYRDGVSENQFSKVLEVEWLAIKKGLAAVFGSKPQPKVSFICVQKRHRTRFYVGEKTDHNQGNIYPGTVVDSDIVHPTQFNFYLASHSAIQGTTRAPHYYVLKNEIGLNANDMEAITNALCHSYVRATRAVSYPAPTYYSHWLAKGGAAYLPQNYNKDNLEELNANFRASENFKNAYPMHFV